MRKGFPAGPVRRTRPAGLLLAVVLFVVACTSRQAPAAQVALPSTEAATWAPTWTPAPRATARPTATWVPLPSPLPTVTGTALSKANVPRIDAAGALALVEAGEAVLVDVRPRASYAVLHAEGAISLPLDEVADCLAQLPADRLLIFYCA